MSTSDKSRRKIRIFVSYAHKDQELAEKVIGALGGLRFAGLGATWSDHQIQPGTFWADEIREKLDSADVVILLVSHDFTNSFYCIEKETMSALQRSRSGHCVVIPIVLRPTDWEFLPFADLQALPTGAKALTKWDDEDDALSAVSKGVREVIEELLNKRNGPTAEVPIGSSSDPSPQEMKEPTSTESECAFLSASGSNPQFAALLYVPKCQSSVRWFNDMWEMLIPKDNWRIYPISEQPSDLVSKLNGLDPIRTVLLVGLDSATLADSRPHWMDQVLADIRTESAAQPRIVGVVADGCAPRDACRVRDLGADGAVPFSRLNDPNWMWPRLEDVVKGTSTIRAELPFERPFASSSSKNRRRIAVAGTGEDAVEILDLVEYFSQRMSKKPALLVKPVSMAELPGGFSVLKEAEAVVLRFRRNEATKRFSVVDPSLGDVLAAYLAGLDDMGTESRRIPTFCVAKRREAPDDWPRNWACFAHYEYNCEVDLAIQLYEWLLVKDNGGIIR